MKKQQEKQQWLESFNSDPGFTFSNETVAQINEHLIYIKYILIYVHSFIL